MELIVMFYILCGVMMLASLIYLAIIGVLLLVDLIFKTRIGRRKAIEIYHMFKD